MKYYLHDTSAFDDEKVTELFINFGYEGVGLFYVVLEKLAKQEKPVKTEVLKKQLRVGKRLEKCWFFMEQIGIISSNNGETFNKQLLNFSEKYQIKKEKTRKKVSEWREKQDIAETVTSYNDECNQRKLKKSKVNGIELNNKDLIESEYGNQFEIFRKNYPGTKRGLDTEFKTFQKHKDWKQILPALDERLSRQIEVRAINKQNGVFVPEWKNLQTYLNQRAWEEELQIADKPIQNGQPKQHDNIPILK